MTIGDHNILFVKLFIKYEVHQGKLTHFNLVAAIFNSFMYLFCELILRQIYCLELNVFSLQQCILHFVVFMLFFVFILNSIIKKNTFSRLDRNLAGVLIFTHVEYIWGFAI